MTIESGLRFENVVEGLPADTDCGRHGATTNAPPT
jgi:hypothetical protein